MRNNNVGFFCDFEVARSFVRGLGLKNQKEWHFWIKNNSPYLEGKKIPSNPQIFYKSKGWLSYSDWLGNGSFRNLKNIEYMSYDDCKFYVKKNLKITSKSEWIDLDKSLLPDSIPKRPDCIYKNKGWTNWRSFFDQPMKLSGKVKSKLILSYQDAKDYVRELGIKNDQEYYNHIRINNITFLPLRPDVKYQKEWNGFINFLGVSSNRKSSGEESIAEILNSMGVSYIREKKFDDCKNINQLCFDFYLPDLSILIEYDGELHYKSCDFFGGDRTLERIQKLDKIKDDWCKENNIKLIRIPYYKKKNLKKQIELLLNND